MGPEIVEGFRLSPQQKRLWLLQQTDGCLPYQARCAVTIRGSLDTATLEQAIRTVVGRHEILRTSFRLLPGMSVPVQVISDESTFSLVRDDITALAADEQRARIESLLLDPTGRENDCEQLPLLRGHLVTLSDREHRLILRVPALCADGPSLTRLIDDTAATYAAIAAGVEPSAMQGLQYADFAEWRNQLIEGDPLSAARAYWRRFPLAGLDAHTLPFTKSRGGSGHSFRPANVPIDISADARARIAALAASRGLSSSSFLLACWQTLISRSTGRPDVVVGTAFDGRKAPELETSIGLFSTYCPIQGTVVDDLTFTTMWAQLADGEREAYRWQEYFAWEDPGFFPFCFELRERAGERTDAGLVFAIERQDACTDRFTVKFVYEAGVDRVSANLAFDSSLLSSDDARRMAAQLATLIEDASHRPDAALSGLNMVGEPERQRLLVEFNDTRKAYAAGRCVHELFEQWAAQTPAAVAVVYEADQLTYGELNARANQLAHHLIELGVGPDVPVGLCVERSISMIVGLLGILKAGGAYVPLDPSLPKSRLDLMLEDAGARVLVSTATLAEGLGAQLRRLIRLDADGDLLAARSGSEPARRVRDENLVYVIFTSGSTGRPKGVGVEHRQLVNYVDAVSEALGLSAPSFAMITTIAADLGNTALFPALATGGTLHVISEARATDPDKLSEYFERHHIDCLKIVPSHLTALLSGSNPAGVLPRRRLVLGGEACSWHLVQKIETLAPATVLFNHYGPTEATVGAITHRIDASAADSASATVPLGRPLGNVRAYILDAQLRPVLTGVAGQLHIGGRGVARGYINRPDATAEKFVPDPFGEEPGARLYKTGDRARYLRDGRIEFLGRTDDQVKVHGYRVEPGEVEAALRAHTGLESCVVVPRQDPARDTKLVAYLVARDREAPPVAELRSFLNDRVPEYMIPSAFVFLDRLPLTANGKVDRRALPAGDTRHTNERHVVAPRTAAEETLAAIWSGVLGIDRIGIHDNFFELGGDSILSIQIIARANQAGLRLSPRQLFQHQTVAELAAVAGTTAAAAAAQGLVTGDVPLTPVQARFFELAPPAPHHYNQAVLLELEGVAEASLIERALHHILRHHDALRLRAVPTDSGWRQRIVPPDDTTPFECVDVSPLDETAQTAAVASHVARLHAGLNLEKGPIVRAALFNRGASRNPYLLIVIHHLAVDVVSWRILLEDFDALLRQLSRGEAPVLPAKTTSFKSWAERVTEHARSDTRQAELSRWLADRQPSVHLPVDHAGGDNTAASARTISVSLGADETSALLQDVSVAYRTHINEVLLTALVRVFAPWTGSSSLLLDVEGHGREEVLEGIDLSRTVGWFTTIFPVYLDGGDAETPADTIRLVKERLRALPDRGIGYGLLRYGSGNPAIADKLRALPHAQVRFNYLGRIDRRESAAPVFRVADAPSGPPQSASFPRTYLLNIIGSVSRGELRVEWTYSAGIHRRDTVERLAQQYREQLRSLIAGRHAVSAVSITPSDFPAAKLSQGDLDKVLSRIKGSHTRRGHSENVER